MIHERQRELVFDAPSDKPQEFVKPSLRAHVITIGKLWVYHRRKMLFSDDPFGYIARFL